MKKILHFIYIITIIFALKSVTGGEFIQTAFADTQSIHGCGTGMIKYFSTQSCVNAFGNGYVAGGCTTYPYSPSCNGGDITYCSCIQTSISVSKTPTPPPPPPAKPAGPTAPTCVHGTSVGASCTASCLCSGSLWCSYAGQCYYPQQPVSNQTGSPPAPQSPSTPSTPAAPAYQPKQVPSTFGGFCGTKSNGDYWYCPNPESSGDTVECKNNKCVEHVQNGDPCGGSKLCPSNGTCYGGFCKENLKGGDGCDPSNDQCIAPFKCLPSKLSTSAYGQGSTCQTYTQTSQGTYDCDLSKGIDCPAHYKCSNQNGGPGICQGTNGADCAGSNTGTCQSGLSCTQTSGQEGGVSTWQCETPGPGATTAGQSCNRYSTPPKKCSGANHCEGEVYNSDYGTYSDGQCVANSTPVQNATVDNSACLSKNGYCEGKSLPQGTSVCSATIDNVSFHLDNSVSCNSNSYNCCMPNTSSSTSNSCSTQTASGSIGDCCSNAIQCSGKLICTNHKCAKPGVGQDCTPISQGGEGCAQGTCQPCSGSTCQAANVCQYGNGPTASTTQIYTCPQTTNSCPETSSACNQLELQSGFRTCTTSNGTTMCCNYQSVTPNTTTGSTTGTTIPVCGTNIPILGSGTTTGGSATGGNPTTNTNPSQPTNNGTFQFSNVPIFGGLGGLIGGLGGGSSPPVQPPVQPQQKGNRAE